MCAEALLQLDLLRRDWFLFLTRKARVATNLVDVSVAAAKHALERHFGARRSVH